MNDANKVSVGKPMIGGAVYRAPLGTPLPISASDTLNEAFKGMGYISDDGVTNSGERTTADIKAWGGDTVLNPQTEKKDTFSMKFIESLNTEVLKSAYGTSNVTGDLESGVTIRANAQELDYGAWVIDTILTGGFVKRIVMPNAKVTEIGDIVYKDDEAIGYEETITAYPYNNEGYDGDTHREFIQGASEGGGGDTDQLETLAVSSEAGTDTGTTTVTVSPQKSAENIYKYKLAAEETSVTYDEDVHFWDTWDGESDIEAEADQVITIVEATSDYKARKVGHATVVVA